MSPSNDPNADARRAAAKRTVWVLALIAAGFYGWFIVKAVTSPGAAG
jgi:hypothetical protein